MGTRNQEEIEKATGLFLALKDIGVSTIDVHYSGGGDSGAIDLIELMSRNREALSMGEQNDDEESSFYGYKDKIENIAYCYLNDIEDWWNNEGGHGIFTIDLETMEYSISNNIRVVEEETYEHGGSLLD